MWCILLFLLPLVAGDEHLPETNICADIQYQPVQSLLSGKTYYTIKLGNPTADVITYRVVRTGTCKSIAIYSLLSEKRLVWIEWPCQDAPADAPDVLVFEYLTTPAGYVACDTKAILAPLTDQPSRAEMTVVVISIAMFLLGLVSGCACNCHDPSGRKAG